MHCKGPAEHSLSTPEFIRPSYTAVKILESKQHGVLRRSEFGCGLQNMDIINPFSRTKKHGGNHTDSLEFEYFCCIVFVRGKRGNVRQTYEHSSCY